MAIRSDQTKTGRYAVGGLSTVDGNRISWWERTVFPTDPTDATITITRKYARRPDLVAADVYGKSSLQWFILQYNNISDVNVEFVEGTVISLPTTVRLFTSLLTGTTPIIVV